MNPSYTTSTTIDLTMEDDDESAYDPRCKRMRVEYPQTSQRFSSLPSTSAAFSLGRPIYNEHGQQQLPSFAAQAHLQVSPPPQASSSRQVIDLTGRTPSPSPVIQHRAAPQQAQSMSSSPRREADPMSPVCIGQLTATALVLYPIGYICVHSEAPTTHPLGTEWAPVRLHYDEKAKDRIRPGEETVQIHVPPMRYPDGQVVGGQNFGVVEQKVANTLGPMLGSSLIKVEARVKRGNPNTPILPLEMLVFTPLGNVQMVAQYLARANLLLDHPTPSNSARLGDILYKNPHNPPPGGFRNAQLARPGLGSSRWQSNVNTKSVEVQRTQVDELFKSLHTGDEIIEADPPDDVATSLYPHQKKALTFLLEREREITLPSGKSSSLWTERRDMHGRGIWYNMVTQREVTHQPREPKSALLADDMGLGKTISCVSLVAATLKSARAYVQQPLPPPRPPISVPDDVPAGHFAGAVWGMPDTSHLSNKEASKEKTAYKRAQEEYVRASRIRARSRATLIVCPLSTVANWEEQFREHWAGEVTVVGGASSGPSVPTIGEAGESTAEPPRPPRKGTPIRIYIYHGNARRPEPSFLADFDVVITTYATLASEFSKQSRSRADTSEAAADDDTNSDNGGMDVDGTPKPKGRKKKALLQVATINGNEMTSPLQTIYWFRVILDEAHSIKETSTVGCRASCDLMADRRICLTGTPVQNKLDDVYALIKFMRLEPFDDKAVWTEFVGSPAKFGQHLGIARLQSIMRCITLRRTKDSKTKDGRPILSLPPRKDELRYLKFNESEQAIYNGFFDESKAEFNQLTRTNQVMKNYVGILQKILRLRQICDHWQLVDASRLQAQIQDATQDVDACIEAIQTDGLNVPRGTAVFALLRESGTAQCSECGHELATPLDAVEREAADMDPQCIASSGTKRARKTKTPSASAPATRANSPVPAAPKPIITRCQHLFCSCCFRKNVSMDWPEPPSNADSKTACPTCHGPLVLPTDAVEVSPDGMMPSLAMKKKGGRREKRQRAPGEQSQPSTKILSLMHDLVHFSRMNRYSANYNPSSLEFELVDEHGNNSDDNIVKTVVFSQWTSMLDKIEDALEDANIVYDRLDGTMKRDERTRAMDNLKHNPACEVLLVSLKAGGVGLNLTAAQRVYLMDPYWNPAVENQAVDRIHRLGQTRPVTTIKFIIENSIEARLLQVQKKKSEMANMTLGQGISKADLLQRRMEDLQELFG